MYSGRRMGIVTSWIWRNVNGGHHPFCSELLWSHLVDSWRFEHLSMNNFSVQTNMVQSTVQIKVFFRSVLFADFSEDSELKLDHSWESRRRWSFDLRVLKQRRTFAIFFANITRSTVLDSKLNISSISWLLTPEDWMMWGQVRPVERQFTDKIEELFEVGCRSFGRQQLYWNERCH